MMFLMVSDEFFFLNNFLMIGLNLFCWFVVSILTSLFLFFLAIQEHQRRCLETTNVYLEKQPLFPLPICSFPEADCNISKSNDPSRNTSVASPIHKVPKKTLAATLVENTKKQSVASVPLEIAKLAQAFCSLFNPALFPHKPPSSAVANRVLFTDAEDV